ncbi:MAG TPA: class I SAM-dependent methyltransferase [Solirubrobacterales bacterium]|nr:class I SAM-dependent methyltransferase [Solirubrobacterales bacterium]
MADPQARRLTAYTGDRPDVAALVPDGVSRALDVGCSDGSLGATLRERGIEVHGIERDPDLADRARSRLDVVLEGDAIEMLSQLADGHFDLVVCADLLEHLADPWSAMRHVRRVLDASGECIVSLPNVRFWTTFTQLGLHGRWPRHSRGVHDRTHLSWFTDADARRLFDDTGFEVRRHAANYRLWDEPWRRGNRIARHLAMGPLEGFLAYQHLYLLSLGDEAGSRVDDSATEVDDSATDSDGV